MTTLTAIIDSANVPLVFGSARFMIQRARRCRVEASSPPPDLSWFENRGSVSHAAIPRHPQRSSSHLWKPCGLM